MKTRFPFKFEHIFNFILYFLLGFILLHMKKLLSIYPTPVLHCGLKKKHFICCLIVLITVNVWSIK